MIDAGVEFESPHPQVEDPAADTLEEWADLDITFDQPDPPEPSAESGQDAGDADEYSEHWFLQAENGTCVPASVAQIVAEYTGEDIRSEEAFIAMAQENGYFAGGDVSGGMSIYAAADLLEQSGIPASVETGTMSDLSTALEEGRGVLLYVDSGEYWDPEQEERDEARGRDEGGDHCVVISEIDYDKGVVYLSDPGHPDGDRMEVPLDEFEEAWGDADNTMIVCDEPSPNSGVHDTAPSDTAPSDAGDPLLEAGDTRLDNAIDWATARPWLLLPLLLRGE
ncbi:C39 family peptidase [Williamsia sp.]|uniref:C39 family peptidase n=1 Tax=Williamsia sp. TaxID=1872085 RepID=UPI002F92A444